MKKNNTAQYLVLTVIALTALIASWNMYRSPDSSQFGLVLFIVAVLGIVAVAIMWVVNGIALKKFIIQRTKEITQTEKESLLNFPAPMVIIDDAKQIVWMNRDFDKYVLDEMHAYKMYIGDLADFDFNKLYSDEGDKIRVNNKYYTVKAVANKNTGSNFSLVYFDDNTELHNMTTEYLESRPAVMLVAVDSYEELMQDSRESEKAKVSAQLEQLMETFFDSTTGVVRKLSSSRFLVVLEYRYLRTMIEGRFPILDKAREINIGERMTVTLSIGVGNGGKTLAENAEFARQGLDMCFGRGGDQAAVKTGDGFEFYGGVSKGVEKQTKVRTRIIANALRELVGESSRVYIMGHSMADLDAIGSAVGLCALIRRLGTPAFVAVDPNRNLSDQLISYIRSKQSDEFFVSPAYARDNVDEDTLLVIVDTHNPDFVDSPELLKMCGKTVVIDHHRRMVKAIENSVIFFHEPMASSTSEMVAELAQYFGNECKLTACEAEALLAGIMLDTKNFVMRTGVRTFEAAAFLRKLGADTVSVKNLFSSSIETYQQKSMLITNAEIYDNCAVATARATSPTMRIAAPQAADELLGIDGVKASFVMYEDGGKVQISARSLGGFNVQLVMEALGGGGHQTMAGAQMNATLRDAKHLLLDAIDDYIEKSTAK